MNFFKQRKKLKKIESNSYRFYGKTEAPAPDNRKKKDHLPYVQLQESLTNMNAELLRIAREKAGSLGYEFAGYVTNGQVRVKKRKDSKFIAIKCKFDIDRIV